MEIRRTIERKMAKGMQQYIDCQEVPKGPLFRGSLDTETEVDALMSLRYDLGFLSTP